MNPNNDYQTILAQINQPAFLVQDGIITAVNRNAENYFIAPGTPIDELLIVGKEEYHQLQAGSLYLTVHASGTNHPCVVSCLEDGHLFTINTSAQQSELQVLSLAAQQLTFPMSELSLLLDQLDDSNSATTGRIRKDLARIKRIIRNMSDASRYVTATPTFQSCDIYAVLAEILEKAQTLLAESGTTLTYRIPNQPLCGMINQEMIRRAVYNLLSNAAKFSDETKHIDVQVTQNAKKLYFTVTSQKPLQNITGNMFNRYLRQPGLEDRKYGLGLGMSLIHAAAVAHKGTVLIDQDEKHQFRVTMTLSVIKNTDSVVRSPVLLPDFYGGNDQALIELSDVLSTDLYQ